MEWLSRAIHGDERLWRVFWVYGIILGVSVLSVWSGLLTYFISFMVLFAPHGGWVLAIIMTGILGCWLEMLWACADQANRRFWFYLVRGFVIFATLLIVWQLLRGLLFGAEAWLSSLLQFLPEEEQLRWVKRWYQKVQQR